MKGKGSPSILLIDIETSPLVSSHWQLYDIDISLDSIIKEWAIISIAWQWDCEDKVYSLTVDPKDPTNDLKIVRRMHELISAADIVVAHNGDAFDMKKFMARVIFHDLPPIEPKTTVDTLKVCRKIFKFTSNKLDYVGQYLKLGKKIETPKGLWMKACFGNFRERQEALKIMSEYNEGDVLLLKKVYHKLRPYMPNHPNQNLFHPDECCPVCASKKIQRRGHRITRTGRKRQFQCQDCGAWSAGKLVDRVEIR